MSRDPDPFPPGPSAIVGVGGSAGALDGYERFFLGLPAGAGLALIVVPHLDPQAPALMPELLRRCTPLPVLAVTDGLLLEPDTVYVLPPGHSLSLMNGRLLLDDLELAAGRVIDHFFESLALDQGERAVGVLLSGMGSDGTRGCAAIKEHFGTVLVQDPTRAEYPDMPRSVADSGLANAVLPAEELGPRLYSLLTQAPPVDPAELGMSAPLQKILRLVRVRSGHDFSQYKRSTLVRRIERRMHGLGLKSVAQYVQLLQDTPAELDELFGDLTINVTSFFRDPEAFEELSDQLRRYLLEHKQDHDPVRVWVAGCSSGEEAYSVAIVLRELAQELEGRLSFKAQVFATDIAVSAVDRARAGHYGPEIAAVLSPERLAAHFLAVGGGYQVRGELREMVVFALHNTFGDPPFTRLDLLCCRNVLIYLGQDLQRQVLALFHYALRPGGLLFLGASETVGPERERFRILSSRWKIFQRGEGSPGTLPSLHAVSSGLALSNEAAPLRPPRAREVDARAQALLLGEYAPPAVVVSETGELLYVSGRTARYLELPPGKSSLNAFDMGRGALRFELPAAVRQAALEGRELTRAALAVDIDGAARFVDLTVRPMGSGGPLLVVFSERAMPDEARASLPPSDRVSALERELVLSRESLRASLEEMAVGMEELKSTNEELQTTNEELQSSNEELTTSKEELQSLNEELITINAEHHRVIADLAQAGDDMRNLLESAGVATVFLGNDLRIRRFTPRITRVINLMPVDVGRPLTDISVNLRYEALTQDIARVLDTLEAFETQVQTLGGQWYLMRISPYRTSDNFIDGVVVAFTNIDLVKNLEHQLREALDLAAGVLNSTVDALLVFDAEQRVVASNRALQELLRLGPDQLQGERLYHLADFALDQPELQARLHQTVAAEQSLTNFVIDLKLPYLGERKMKVEAEPLPQGEGNPLFMLKLEDVTGLLQQAARQGEDLRGQVPDGPTTEPAPE